MLATGSLNNLLTPGCLVAAGNPDEWLRVLHLNLHANQRLIRWLCPSMKEKGRGWVLNINSTNGLHPSAGTPAYCASKWGMRGWSLSLHDVRTCCCSGRHAQCSRVRRAIRMVPVRVCVEGRFSSAAQHVGLCPWCACVCAWGSSFYAPAAGCTL